MLGEVCAVLIAMFLIWIVLCGRVTADTVTVGAVICCGVYILFCGKLGFSPKKEWRFVKKTGLFALYLVELFVGILSANFTMMNIVLNPRRKVTQTLVHFDAGLRTRYARTLFANAITLTPGTITVDVDGDRFTVHCISRELANDFLDSGKLLGVLRRMEAVS